MSNEDEINDEDASTIELPKIQSSFKLYDLTAMEFVRFCEQNNVRRTTGAAYLIKKGLEAEGYLPKS